MNEQHRLAEQLEGVLLGNVDVNALLEEPSWFAGSTAACYHGLQHYAADEDIRRRDVEYSGMQRSEMRKLIALLRSGANSTQLERITFLGESK